MKYIDAEKLKASVQKGFNSAKESEEYDDDMYETGRADAYEDVIHIIDSLQQEQPEVDLEKEMDEYFKGWTETDEGIACHYQYVNLNTCRGIARHFYELGLNARKED